MSDSSMQVIIQNHLYFNYSFCLHSLPFLEKIVIKSNTVDYHHVDVKISSSLGIFEAYSCLVDLIRKEDSHLINRFPFKYNLPFLRDLKEKDTDTISVSIVAGHAVLYETTFSITIFPIDYFGGLQVHPELLLSYAMPNDDTVYQIKTAAVRILEQSNVLVSFEGYQSGSKDRVLQMVDAIYQAIQHLDIVYSAMPASFETEGQRIRLADQVLKTRFGNCVDISLLFVACLEAIDLNPILIITKGHAFVGVWLDNQRLDSMINFDQAAISKRMASGIREICLIESTQLCKGTSFPLKKAMDLAEMQILDVDAFLLSIDIKSARAWGVTPLSLTKDIPFLDSASGMDMYADDATINHDYALGQQYDNLELTDYSNLSKQKVWERKLLDLSLRNNLLNLRFTKSMLQLLDVNVNSLEDALANNKAFTIQPNNNQPVLKRYNLYAPPLHASEPMYKLAEEEFGYNRLLTHYHQEDLGHIVTHLFRNAKIAEEENGRSTLYMGLGLLKWYDTKSKEQARYAPLLLVPVELSRKSVNAKYYLRSREEETMFNITLLEYLKQEYQLNLDSLETLPMDDSGIDVYKVFAILRRAILNLAGWDVLEQVVLGNFSFNKLILWQDISRNAEQIQRSVIVSSLIEGKLNRAFDIRESHEDLEKLPSSHLNLPIATDYSQLAAIKYAHANQTFVLHGPPGTGKSQTITNIIANALANNKKVLFVAAKKAALDVVHKRLEKIGLGPFCLEIHSNKSKKSDVINQLARTLDLPKYQSRVDFQEEATRIDERKAAIRKYIDALHQTYPIGWTLYESISYLDSHEVAMTQKWIMPMDVTKLDTTTWHQWKDWSVAFASLSRKIPDPAEHPLRMINLKNQAFSHKAHISSSITAYLAAKGHLEEVNESLQLNLPPDFQIDFSELVQFLTGLRDLSLPMELITVLSSHAQRNVMALWMEQQSRKQQVEDRLLASYSRRILDADTTAVESLWNQAQHAWFLPRWLKKRKVKQYLNGFCTTGVGHDSQVWDLFQDLDNYRAILSDLQSVPFAEMERRTTSYRYTNGYNLAQLNADLAIYYELDECAQQLYFQKWTDWFKDLSVQKTWRNDVNVALDAIREFIKYFRILREFLTTIPEDKMLDTALHELEGLDDWIRYNHYKQKADEINLSWFIKLLEERVVDKNVLESELESVVHFNVFVTALEKEEVLNNFDADVYTSTLEQYKSLYHQFVGLTKDQLILQLSNSIPNLAQEAMQSSEIGILQRNIRNKGRGTSIRRLFDLIPTLLPRLKPCMLMSPISVAQYFDVTQDHFDLVIFDEASQLPTSEAVSALARARQAIIVGDPKQMPPTSFFVTAKLDEDHLELEDLESILDDTLALSIPSKYLLRHYRSKHESLISFSNHHFYESKLLTFPSADDLDKKVTLQWVSGHYDKGNSRTNKMEAETIVAYIKNHLEHKPDKSIGVVTFSQTQQSLIEDLLQNLFVDYPNLEEIANQEEEPIFIKNLENVQGDERDVILFSIGYGPDANGKVSMNFGPLNRDGGWRRLNVAVTRARYEMKVFSSLKADQIDLARTKAEGVKGLKNFLHFAEHGHLENTQMVEAHRVKYELVDAIADYLTQHGLTVKTAIGTSGYRVDIGVVDPRNPNRYILGIIVDGKNYIHTQTTNDRELLIPDVLQSLGWNIFRIWTLDWLKNKAYVVTQIDRRIQQLVERPHVEELNREAIMQAPIDAKIANSIMPVSAEVHQVIRQVPYKDAGLSPVSDASSESIYQEENRGVIRTQLATFIRTESPISQPNLFRKVLRLWNTQRAGAKLVAYLNEIVTDLSDVTTRYSYQLFYYDGIGLSDEIDYYRDNSIEKRNIEDIAPEEIEVAVMEFLQQNLSISKDELIRAMGKVFGFNKVGIQIESVISFTLNRLIDDGKVKFLDGRILLA